MAGWAGSTRRSRLPPDWGKRRVKVKARAKGRCQATRHVPECDGIGAECDHVVPGDDHSLPNLQWLSASCHWAKTLAEAKQASGDHRAALKLPREPHPNRAH